MTDPVTAALAAVDYDAWVTDEHGGRAPQSSSPRTIERMLRLLDLRLGQRVMEIGTGSGYTAALLAHAVGEHGHVVSLDDATSAAARLDGASLRRFRVGHAGQARPGRERQCCPAVSGS